MNVIRRAGPYANNSNSFLNLVSGSLPVNCNVRFSDSWPWRYEITENRSVSTGVGTGEIQEQISNKTAASDSVTETVVGISFLNEMGTWEALASIDIQFRYQAADTFSFAANSTVKLIAGGGWTNIFSEFNILGTSGSFTDSTSETINVSSITRNASVKPVVGRIFGLVAASFDGEDGEDLTVSVETVLNLR